MTPAFFSLFFCYVERVVNKSMVSVSDWLKVRSFRFDSPETQNKKPKIILISKIYFKKFTVNKQRYFTMFTKLNRVLLASGLAIASAAMLSPAAFAAPIKADGTPLVVTGTPTAFAAITVTGSGNSFPITYGTAISNQKIATVAYSTNAIGAWHVDVAGDVDSKTPAFLEAPGLTAKIPFTVSLGSGSLVAPATTTVPAVLSQGSILSTDTSVVDTTQDLAINILAPDTKVPTAPDGSPYAETLSVTLTSGQ